MKAFYLLATILVGSSCNVPKSASSVQAASSAAQASSQPLPAALAGFAKCQVTHLPNRPESETVELVVFLEMTPGATGDLPAAVEMSSLRPGTAPLTILMTQGKVTLNLQTKKFNALVSNGHGGTEIDLAVDMTVSGQSLVGNGTANLSNRGPAPAKCTFPLLGH